MFARLWVQILLPKRALLRATGQRSGITNQMETGEGRPIHKRRAIERGRKISNATISLILSFVVTAAAQSERTNQGVRMLEPPPVTTPLTSSPMGGTLQEPNETVTIAPGHAACYDLATRGITETLKSINGL